MLFGPFRFDETNECLWRDEKAITLTPKAFAVLRHLLTHAGRLVTKEEILEAVWPKTYVGDAVLKVCIGEIRKALVDNAKTPLFIETVHRRGYRFIAPLNSAPPGQRTKGKGQSQGEGLSNQLSVGSLDKVKSAPLAPAHWRPLARLVGREPELAQLQRALEKALSGERQVVFVTGEAGIGKTALVEAFLQSLESRVQRLASEDQAPPSFPAQTLDPRLSDSRLSDPGPRTPDFPTPDARSLSPGPWIARGQCLEHYGASEPYLPVFEALTCFSRELGRERLAAVLDRYAPTWLTQMPALISIEERQRLQRETLSATPERMLREMAEAIEALTAERPILFMLEDLQWSDYATLDLLSALARRRGAARLLVLSSYRPAEVEMRGHPLRSVQQELLVHGFGEELALEPLDAETVKVYLEGRFTQGSAAAELAPFVYKQTGGHPLFMVNAVEHLLGQGIVAVQEEAWRVTGNIQEIELTAPDSLQQIIVQRVERLHAVEQRALEAASAVGGEFSATAVAVALREELTAIEEVCDRLARRGQFLRMLDVQEEPDGTVSARYRFVHSLYQRTLSERLSAAQRLRFQRRIGEWVESVYGDRVDGAAAELAMRFELSRDYARAAPYLRKAGENAMRKHAPREAVEYFRKGLRLLQTLPDSLARAREELLLQMALGPALMATQGYAAREVEQAYRRAQELCQLTGDATRLFPILWGLWLLYLVRAELPTARTLGEQLLELAHTTGDPALLLQVRNALGTTLYHLGEFSAAREQVEPAATAYRADAHHFLAELYGGEDPGVVCLCFLALSLWMLGYPEQAAVRMQEALTLARKLRHPFSLAEALGFAAVLHQYTRQTSEALARAQELSLAAEAQGFPYWSAAGIIVQGWALAAQGRHDEGSLLIQQGLTMHRAAGTELFRPYWLALLAEAHHNQGRPDDGLQALAEAFAASVHSDERVYEAELYRLKGELLLAAAPRR